MLISLIKSSTCLLFFILLWLSPAFRNIIVRYFNHIESFLVRNKKIVIIITFGLYIIITVILQFYHSIDGDETQAWLIARDSGSLWNMYSLMGYEGSPGLWHTLLFPLARSGVPFQVIYFLNHLFAIAALFLWLRFAPFPLLILILFPFIHVFLTEYSINARSYALSIFLLFTALTLYKNYYNKWFLWSFVFFLFANTNIPSALLTCGFAFFLFLSSIFLKNKTHGKALVVIGTGIILAVIQVYPSNDLAGELSGFKLQFTSGDNIMAPMITGAPFLSMLIYLAIIAQVIISFKNKFLLYGFLSAQIGLFVLFFFKYHGDLRHHFFLILSIFLFLWIDDRKENKKNVTNLFLFPILIMMSISAGRLVINKITNYSEYVKDMAYYINSEVHPDSTTFIACHPDNMSVGILPYLSIKSLYMPDNKKWGSYVTWNQQRISGIFNPAVVQNVVNLSKDHPGYNHYYYLTIHELPADSVKYHHIELLKEITSQYLVSVGSDWQTYYLYQLPGK